jgi:cyclophilin family peptidyl-prolyl cis-trans isomerase
MRRKRGGKGKFLLLAIVLIVVVIASFILLNPFQPASNSSTVEEFAVIETRFGSMTIKFFPQVAPAHVQNFKNLARQGFYNSTTFHRVIPNFMIQGGDPNSKDDDRSNDGIGGPGYTIPAEFNSITHKRGIVSMARAQDPNSAGSQFFIVVKDSPYLDGQYTVFGEVIKGIEVADKIGAEPRDARDNPINKIEMEVVITTNPQ